MIGVIYSAIMLVDPIQIHRMKRSRASTSPDKLSVFYAHIVMVSRY
jgi:hypothetical protein